MQFYSFYILIIPANDDYKYLTERQTCNTFPFEPKLLKIRPHNKFIILYQRVSLFFVEIE